MDSQLHVRIDAEAAEAAKRVARERGQTLSERVRYLLARDAELARHWREIREARAAMGRPLPVGGQNLSPRMC